MDNIKSKKIRCFLLIILAAIFSFFILKKVDLTTVDLGRHIRNGQDFFEGNFGFLRSNFYSFTYSDFPFINHHWGAGVIFFSIYKIAGFKGIHLLFLLIGLASFYMVFRIAEKEANTTAAFILSLVLLPLLSYRKEIRAEVFSCFFAVLFFWILWNHKRGSISDRFLFILPILEILWINAHIYFFLGPLIISAFLIESIISRLIGKKQDATAGRLKTVAVVFVFSIIAAIINPFGIKGILHPLNVYNNYGYRVLEEQSVLFLEKLGIVHSEFLLFKAIIILLILSFLLILLRRNFNISPKEGSDPARGQTPRNDTFPLSNFFLALGFGAMASVSIRNIALFGFFALPILAANIKIFFKTREAVVPINPNEINSSFKKALIAMPILAIFAVIIFTYIQTISCQRGQFGLGIVPLNSMSADFFKSNDISGPIFNNYDIGGYLIFHLYPKEQVFVDNRPEVYPVSFFKDIYVPMQQENELWKKQNAIYDFNAIYFSYKDSTPWGQEFLIKRIDDPEWVPVFVDNFSIVFLKRNEKNERIIKEFEIPRSNFSVKKL